MSAEIADRLRALARDHLEGRSSLQSYRRLRAQLLDSLVVPPDGGSPEATQPRAAMQLGEVTQPRAAALPQAAAERSAPPPADIETRMGRGRVAAYVALGLLLTCAVVFLVSRHHLRGVAAPRGTAATSSGAGAETAQTDPIQALLQPLLENPDWSDDRLLALNEALLEAGRARLEAVSNTDWYQAFLESVRSRLRQQQALAGTPLTPDSSPLAALAVTLGIDLSAQAESAKSAAPAQGGPGAAVPQKSAAPQRSTEQAKPAQHAAGAGASPRGKSESSLAPAPVSGPAASDLANTTPHATDVARSAVVKPASSPAANPVSASAPAASQNAPAKASAHHEYPACSAALSQTRLNYCQDFLAAGDPGPLLAVIPGGSFLMGNGELAQEGPVHRVTLSYGFAMSVYEVSQSEFQLYCRTSGKACPQQPWTRGDDPVVNVSWRDAQDYARWLSVTTHQRYRLPTEAEWEYAARAGQAGLYPSGDSLSPTDAYFSMGATLTVPAPRSTRFNANAWHLMHMVGNAREWVQDDWSPSFSGAPADGSARSQGEAGVKVVRGGCYADQSVKLRLTTREPLPADTRDRCTGIRLVRELSP